MRKIYSKKTGKFGTLLSDQYLHGLSYLTILKFWKCKKIYKYNHMVRFIFLGALRDARIPFKLLTTFEEVK